MKQWLLIALALLGASPGCEPSSATDRQKRIGHGGCDVCPLWCREVDLRPIPMDRLISLYRETARYYGHVERSNGKAWVQLERFACIVKRGGEEARRRFVALLDDDDMAVRYAAAVHAIQHRFAPEDALRVLAAIAESDTPLRELASVKLIHWEAGIPVEH